MTHIIQYLGRDNDVDMASDTMMVSGTSVAMMIRGISSISVCIDYKDNIYYDNSLEHSFFLGVWGLVRAHN